MSGGGGELVLVTGGTGYIATYCIKELLFLGDTSGWLFFEGSGRFRALCGPGVRRSLLLGFGPCWSG